MEQMEFEQKIRINRLGNKKKKSHVKLYVYLIALFLLLTVISVGTWFLMQDSKPMNEVQEMPLELSLDIPEVVTSDDNQIANNQSNDNLTSEKIINQTIQSNLPLIYANNEPPLIDGVDPNNPQVSPKGVENNVKKQPNEASSLVTQGVKTTLPTVATQTTSDRNKQTPSTPETNITRQVITPNTKTTVIQTTPAVELNTQAVQISPNVNSTTVIKQSSSAQGKSTNPSQVQSNNTRSTPILQPETAIVKQENNTVIAQQLQQQLNQQAEIPQNKPAVEPVPNISQKNQQLPAQKTTPKLQTNHSTPQIDSSKAQKPAAKSTQKQTKKTEQMYSKPVKINNGRGGNYTIQVASAASPEGLRKLAVSQNLITARVIETTNNGSRWYVLVTGHYASAQEAKNAIQTLPSKIQANHPWVRKSP
ncbi:SPOR domain-containing protein [Thorsellia kenyensis]|uniref:SPOR domain-containing protein n=1 Tax=Thorsellia kenyensis TaxID=1549888 RepID=A0ABV6CCL7_9GAMM